MPKLFLYSLRDNEVQPRAGLNWGFSKGHVAISDAYIPISTQFIRVTPDFFPSQGSTIRARWDDGEEMTLLLEGTQTVDGRIFPKQLSTYNDKSILGVYLRRRIGVDFNTVIKMRHLDQYGKNYVNVSYNSQTDTYEFDFS